MRCRILPMPLMGTRSLANRIALAILTLFALGASDSNAQQARVGNLSRLEAWRQHQQMASESNFKDLQWNRLGPKFAGGRIESIDAPSGDLGIIYAGVGAGGVWKTTNGGLSWKPIFENESTFAIGDLTVAPGDPNTIWVGTGECHVGRMSFSGTGVFKSEDAGETWTNMGLHESYHVGQIAIDPLDKETVYVASMGERNQGGQRGVFKTTDGGKSFKHVLPTENRVSIVDLVIDPSNRDRLFASAWDRSDGSGSCVYRSDDGGDNWLRLKGGLPDKNIDRVAIAVSKSSPGTVYALMADRSSPALAKRRPASLLFRSDDFGNTWTQTHEGYVPTYVGWDFCDVRVAPDDAERIYIGGFRLLQSLDGGKTFLGEGGLAHNDTREKVLRLHDHQGKGLHLDVHDIWIDPEHPERVMLGNDGGLFVSSDRGDSWLHLNNLPIAEYYRVHLDDQTPFQIWGGTQDNASLVGPSTSRMATGEPDEFEQVFLDPWSGGDGFATFPDPNDPKTVFFTQQNGNLKRAIFGKLDSGKRIWPRSQKGEPSFRWAWDTPFFASQHKGPTVLYCAAQQVMRSTDLGDHWNPISPSLSQGPILALAESPLDSARMAAGDGHGKVFLTKDAGKSWESAAALPDRIIQDVVCSVHNPRRVYVVLSGRVRNDTASYAYVSNDFGKTWNSIAAGIPHESLNAIAEDPMSDQLLFIGTDLGVYASTDQGGHWSSLSKTLPTAAVLDVQVQARDGVLVAATHGLSLFSIDIETIRKTAAAK
ncbi:MAG: photosystem II stability/assembly factor-like uncharacterized protein [Mariniblastus sp.]|jgi:photosystem II stability/assembly factor-like uncharacterized protein